MVSTRTNSMDYSPHSDYGFFMGWYIAVSPNVCKTHTQNARENRARKNRKKNLGRHWLGYGRAGHWNLVALLCSVDQDLESSCLASCCALSFSTEPWRVHTSRTHKKQNQNHSVSRELASSLFGWLIRIVAGSWRSTAGWFVWEKNIVLAGNLRSFTTSHGQTNRLIIAGKIWSGLAT